MPSSPATTASPQRFATLCSRLGLSLDAEQAFDDLVRYHHMPPRAYHDMTHVAECLQVLDSVRHLADEPDAIEVAIWYHDAVLDNRQADNELNSARLARDVLLGAGASEDLAARVLLLIMATCHDAQPETQDAKIMVDCDLAILGQDSDRFRQYDEAIREEYRWVPEDVYRQKRAEVLQQFLDLERIYQTDHFHARFEQNARENLKRMVESLILNS